MTAAPSGRLRAATRGSALALVQTELVAAALRALDPALVVENVEVRTEGDRDRSTPLSVLGGRGVFVRAVEEALLEGRADIAVHSLKDMPTTQLPGLTLAAVLPRADLRDALVAREGRRLADLRHGARVGTSSRRRVALLHALRPDAEAVEIRGNVDTRLRKVAEGEYDAAILAAAGLERLGRISEAAELFEPERFLPAPGQGAIVVQCRADDAATLDRLAAIDHRETHLATDAERGFLAALGSGCSLPVGAYARIEGDTLTLRGFLGADESTVDPEPRFDEIEGAFAHAEALGRELGARMLAAVGGAT
jgi:hydroxymethylbilane synthase